MKQDSFLQYKRKISWVLCLAYLLQLPFFGIANYFLQSSADDIWVFGIGFWGLNVVLIFLLDFFHVGFSKSPCDLLPALIFLALSGGYYCALSYRAYWISAVLIAFCAVATFLLRRFWNRSCNRRYPGNKDCFTEESVVRFAIYTLPAILLATVCTHIENVLPSSFFSVLVRSLYFVTASALIVTTHLAWYKGVKGLTYKQLLPEVLWLLIAFLIFVATVGLFKNAFPAFLLPIGGIIPVLIRHKKTK